MGLAIMELKLNSLEEAFHGLAYVSYLEVMTDHGDGFGGLQVSRVLTVEQYDSLVGKLPKRPKASQVVEHENRRKKLNKRILNEMVYQCTMEFQKALADDVEAEARERGEIL
ncbi:hypothetical protein [Pseudomonas phage vB_PaeM_PAO1_Ab06]|uniref:Uncharacterized protein n=1 Tax=Pseudomonas phage vB_PaeM_PAO1_Ab06 TaxID=1548910 RepID=A0A0C7U035_9CAUD|nr:hypothetical protein [Pseudomonas phage vB_PaeM_PAO1_Ab06]